MPFPSPLLYTITDTAIDIVHVGVLQQQITAAGVVQPVEYINADSLPAGFGQIEVFFAGEVSDSDKAIVDATVATHQGKLELTFKATSTLVPSEESVISSDASWQTIGGVVSNVQFFIPDLTKAVGRVQGVSKAVGNMAELRIVEKDLSDGSEVVIAQAFIVESAQETAFAFVTTTTPRPGTMEYRLEGRRNGSASASVGFTSMTLLEATLVGLRPSA
jgi:hypothetical protein